MRFLKSNSKNAMETPESNPSTEPSISGRGKRVTGRYWLLTITADGHWQPGEVAPPVIYYRGQKERGEGGFEHFQVFAQTRHPATIGSIKNFFGGRGHVELSRSRAAEEYVWKEDTRIGEPFQFGQQPKKRNSQVDWQKIKDLAQAGDINSPEIPADIFIRYYGTLRSIAKDYQEPTAMERTCAVFYGRTGTGKSRKAFHDAGADCYSKNPNTKFWDGYRGQKNVVIDEFRGRIDISYLLRWLDRYAVSVEIKGGAVPLKAENFWITSNLSPEEWYPELDKESYDALKRRIKIYSFNTLINI